MAGVLLEPVGSVSDAPEQTAGIALKVVVAGGVTVTVSVAVVAHSVPDGVNV